MKIIKTKHGKLWNVTTPQGQYQLWSHDDYPTEFDAELFSSLNEYHRWLEINASGNMRPYIVKTWNSESAYMDDLRNFVIDCLVAGQRAT